MCGQGVEGSRNVAGFIEKVLPLTIVVSGGVLQFVSCVLVLQCIACLGIVYLNLLLVECLHSGGGWTRTDWVVAA